jgi:hypothetical protein
LAQSGLPDALNQCPLLGVKRTLRKLLTKDEARRIAANIGKAAGSCLRGSRALELLLVSVIYP